MTAQTTRAQIIAVADQLFYERGFEATSFADIAQAVHISRGNFYYHFKTKDDILGAVIAARLDRTQGMLDGWSAASAAPQQRIRDFIHILLRNKIAIKAYGCPVGTLCAELAKLEHASRDEAATVFALFREWLRRQFELLGCGNKSDRLAMHVLGRSQGIAALANAFRDETYIQCEVQQLCDWLADQAAQAEPHQPSARGPNEETRP
jgi:TetR/AcrR family transcriptional regulator, transcriptional repressor for nem operon